MNVVCENFAFCWKHGKKHKKNEWWVELFDMNERKVVGIFVGLMDGVCGDLQSRKVKPNRQYSFFFVFFA